MHAPGNSATIQTMSRAYPGQQICIFAEVSHLRELRKDQALIDRPGISFHPVTLDRQFLHRPHIVSLQRFLREMATIYRALRHVPGAEPCLIMLISATSTSVFAASLVARIAQRRCGIQVGLHGNLNDLTGWRSRSPLSRALDTRSALTGRHVSKMRFLVLE